MNMTTPHSDFRARRNEMIDLFKSFLFDSSEMSRSMFRFELIYMLVNVVTNILEDVGDPFKYFFGNVKTNQILGRIIFIHLKKNTVFWN